MNPELREEIEQLISDNAKVCKPSNYSKTWITAIVWVLAIAGAIFILGLIQLQTVTSAAQVNKETIAQVKSEAALSNTQTDSKIAIVAKDVEYIKSAVDRIDRKLDGPRSE